MKCRGIVILYEN